jgi:hypothetical protein
MHHTLMAAEGGGAGAAGAEEELRRRAGDGDGDGEREGDDSSGSDGEEKALEGAAAELGFCEKPDEAEGPVLAEGRTDWASWDAGKVGGKVVWLDRAALPSATISACAKCGRGLRLLAQIYAPAEEVEPAAFHRMVYVLACMRGSCVRSGRGVLALRGQLPRRNPWLPEESGAERGGEADGVVEERMCAVTGTRGSVQGSLRVEAGPLRASTERLWYATEWEARAHARHVEEGVRRAAAALAAVEDGAVAAREVPVRAPSQEVAARNGWVWPEWDLLVEEEPDAAERRAALERQSAAELEGLMRHVRLVDSGDGGKESGGGDEMAGFDTLSQRELGAALGAVRGADRFLRAFQRRVAARPSQCVRYQRWDDSAVLWLRKDGQPDAADGDGERPSMWSRRAPGDAEGVISWVGGGKECAQRTIPCCHLCGAPRAFEFQLCPQLISKLARPSLQHSPGSDDTSSPTTTTTKDLPLALEDDQDLDFATIAVFTCSKACAIPSSDEFGAYAPEFAWIQLEE